MTILNEFFVWLLMNHYFIPQNTRPQLVAWMAISVKEIKAWLTGEKCQVVPLIQLCEGMHEVVYIPNIKISHH